MPAFFDHEIFHLYQRQAVGSQAPQGDEPAWWTMWVEGLATYVSQRMNPSLEAQQVLWYPQEMVRRMENNLPHAAALMLRDPLSAREIREAISAASLGRLLSRCERAA